MAVVLIKKKWYHAKMIVEQEMKVVMSNLIPKFEQLCRAQQISALGVQSCLKQP